jgi:hypothetical protein
VRRLEFALSGRPLRCTSMVAIESTRSVTIENVGGVDGSALTGRVAIDIPLNDLSPRSAT